MGCVIFDNSTSNAADVTSWFTNDNPPVESVSLKMIMVMNISVYQHLVLEVMLE